MRYIEDLKEGENIVDFYLCKQKLSMKSRAGKTYLSIKLQDKTGMIDAKVWELNNGIQNFEEGDYIKIEAMVQSYQNTLQLNIKKIRKAQEGEYLPEDYIPTTDKDIPTLFKELTDIIDTLSNPYIKKLLTNVFINNEVIAKNFKEHSAAKAMHHNYMGGLLEHTLSVTQISDFLSTRYKYCNRDILVSTAMLHDIGKLYELSPFPSNDYTDDGELLGHIIIGTELLTAEASKIEGFPKELLSLLKHSILAHHGEYEYGSPKLPKTVEAFILHCADDLDAKVKIYEDAIEKDNTQGPWVGYHKMLQRNIRKSDFEQ